MATIHFIAIAASLLLNHIHLANGHGYLSSPRSRNLLAFQELVWWPQTENDPEPETWYEHEIRKRLIYFCISY